MASPNTLPIYVKTPFNWQAKLTNQIAARIITTETPIRLGSFGDNGGIVWNIRVQALGVNVATALRIYTRPAGNISATGYNLIFEQSLPLIPIANATQALPEVEVIMPRIYTKESVESRGLVGETGLTLYAALGTAVASGWDISLSGGDY